MLVLVKISTNNAPSPTEAAQISLGVGPSTGTEVTYQRSQTQRKGHLPAQQPLVANSHTEERGRDRPSPVHAGLLGDWTLCRSCEPTTATVRVLAQVTVWAENAFHSPPPPSALIFFLPPFLQWSLSLGWRDRRGWSTLGSSSLTVA